MKTNLQWVANLWEVGSQIRSDAKSIEWEMQEADKALAGAKKLHAEQVRNIKRRSARLEEKIAKLWSPEEIDAAKRGVWLIDGEEHKI